MRLTKVMTEIMAVVDGATTEQPVWGLTVLEKTGRGPSSIYPALERLEEIGWIEGRWETSESANRPRRRYYWPTPQGQRGLRQRKTRPFALWHRSVRTADL
ncbi:PadR family transcriptional regulator [Streptomyces violascens]|uniref:PadR family transcriptional regulator n=1 Tax=Streptomyces violascens TaxID=67381 RepID=UPI0019C34DF4|nr:helix-turn-helix transcriptional regulator [Streptomyces violascens]GGU38204.1 hypothetical protein GCM10010289_68990 [Streptomyces violascens]